LVLEKNQNLIEKFSLLKMKFYKQLSNLHLLENSIELSSFIDNGLLKGYLGLDKDLSRGYQGVAKKSFRGRLQDTLGIPKEGGYLNNLGGYLRITYRSPRGLPRLWTIKKPT